MMDIALLSLLFFGSIAAWMYFTTPRFREVVFGYLILLGVIAFIYGLISGQAPNSHYGPYY